MATTTKRELLSPPAIQELNTLLSPAGHQLITAESNAAKYEKCIERWSAAAAKPAGAVLVPESVAAISIAVRYATDKNLDLAVRGGGHATSGSSSTDGGLLIDLGSSARFTQVQVDRSNGHLVAGGGANWGHVDDAGFAAGLATVGGTVSDTGIGGLTLGGGYGWLSGKLGLTIDNLISVQLVTADGAVVTASKEQNQDLFWAVRGAGHNFGVAVQFVYQGHAYGAGPVENRIAGAEGGQAYAGTLVFPTTLLSQVLGVLNALFGAEGALKGGTAAGGFALTRASAPNPVAGDMAMGPVVILVPVVWLSDKASGDVAFRDLLDLSPIASNLKIMDYPGINRIFQFEPGTRSSLKGCAFKLPIREEFARSLLKSYSRFTEQVPDAAGSVVQFDLLDPTVVATTASNRDMAFSNRGYHLNGAAEAFWHSAENDKVCRQWARDIAAIFKAELKRGGEENTDAVMMYGNLERKSKIALSLPALHRFADPKHTEYDEKAPDVFGANFTRLQKIKAQYDPTNIFNKQYSIQPAE